MLIATETQARVWDVASGKPVGDPIRHGTGGKMVAAIDPDGTRVATGA